MADKKKILLETYFTLPYANDCRGDVLMCHMLTSVWGMVPPQNVSWCAEKGSGGDLKVANTIFSLTFEA